MNKNQQIKYLDRFSLLFFLSASLLFYYFPSFSDLVFPTQTYSSLSSLTDWSPETMRHCIQNLALTLILTILRIKIIIKYVYISIIWFKSAKNASLNAKQHFSRLIRIFLFCASGCYFASLVAIWFPEFAPFFAIFAMATNDYFCSQFINGVGDNFQMIGIEQNAGHQIDEMDIENLDDAQITERIKEIKKEMAFLTKKRAKTIL